MPPGMARFGWARLPLFTAATSIALQREKSHRLGFNDRVIQTMNSFVRQKNEVIQERERTGKGACFQRKMETKTWPVAPKRELVTEIVGES